MAEQPTMASTHCWSGWDRWGVHLGALDCLRFALAARARESEGRRLSLEAIGRERAADWKRAEAAEAERDRVLAALESERATVAERTSELAAALNDNERLRDAVVRLAEGADPDRVLPRLGLVAVSVEAA